MRSRTIAQHRSSRFSVRRNSRQSCATAAAESCAPDGDTGEDGRIQFTVNVVIDSVLVEVELTITNNSRSRRCDMKTPAFWSQGVVNVQQDRQVGFRHGEGFTQSPKPELGWSSGGTNGEVSELEQAAHNQAMYAVAAEVMRQWLTDDWNKQRAAREAS